MRIFYAFRKINETQKTCSIESSKMKFILLCSCSFLSSFFLGGRGVKIVLGFPYLKSQSLCL